MKKILGVVRASTDRQDTKAQKEALKRFIVGKGFYEDEIEWLEANVSSTQRLDVYARLLDQIKERCTTGGIKTVAFFHLNRLGRREKFLIDMKEFFIVKKIQFLCNEPDFRLLNDDGSVNEAGSMLYSIFVSMIAAETRERQEKFKRGKEYNRKSGKYTGGNVLFGYALDSEKRYVIEPDEAAVVRRVFEMYGSRMHSCASIAKTLNDEGVRHRGKRFVSDFVNDMLTQGGYMGESNRGGNVYPAIVDETTYRRAGEVMKGKTSVKTKESVNCHLCNRLIVCPRCGYRYIAGPKLYACLQKRQWRRYDGRTGPCDAPTVNKLILDEAVWELTKNILSADSLKSDDEAVAKLTAEIESAENRLSKLTAEGERLTTLRKSLVGMYAAGEISHEEFDAGRKRNESKAESLTADVNLLKGRIEMLTARRETLSRPLSTRWTHSYAELDRMDWREADKETARELVRGCISGITIGYDVDEKTTVCRIEDLNGDVHTFSYRLVTNHAGRLDCGWIDSKYSIDGAGNRRLMLISVDNKKKFVPWASAPEKTGLKVKTGAGN